MDASSSSKVTVEYHDPSGLFSIVSRDIASRLPLRNLNWQSSTRPLRQIKSLHLEFVPDNFTKNSLRPLDPRVDSDGTTSFDIVRSGVDPRKNAVKERRHQIPGLQTTPYLKIYILRSDDKDTYKATERQKITDWIRNNATSNAKGKGENHDGFEWLIIHVVVPDTTAASEPRWRESSAKDSDELKERKQGMKLPGKSTRTVFDKLRADFNESGKSGQDRVAQIRLTRAQMPPDLLPTPAVATTIEETDEERSKAWNDVMTKFKMLILGPFDLRVRQYEADVAEQESRRAMPGFNFCTFFIHKEGLAKALESIGLVEDALVIYDELSLGLETVLRDIARGQAEGTATTFAPYTDDIQERIVGAGKVKTNGVAAENARPHGDADIDYREKIVRSDISVFDFFSYLFSRQKALILRLANAKSASSFTKDGGEDLVLISEVCWRAASFIHNVARTLRRDLKAYNSAQWEKGTATTLSNADIDSIVYSWTYTVAGQILEETSSPSVDQFSELPNRRESLSNGSHTNHKLPYSYGGASAHPQRTTSLPPRKSRLSELQGRTSLQSASESDLMMSPPLRSSDDETKPAGVSPGLLELVTYRAELFMMQRKMMELLAKQREWVAGWALVKENARSSLEDVDLNGSDENSVNGNDQDTKPEASHLLTSILASALASKETFHDEYERLSDKAMRYYVAVTHTKSAESIMGDLAILKSQQGDFGYAVTYFQHVLALYAADGWSLMEDDSLRMHAKCLKELDRKEEYVATLLALVAKACGRVKAQRLLSAKSRPLDEIFDVHGMLPELVTFSETLEGEITNPAEQFFSDIQLEPEVLHHQDNDGFALHLRLRHLLDDEVKLDQVSARLVHVDDPNLEIVLTDISPGALKRGTNEFRLEAPTVAFGPYLVDKIKVQAKKLLFVKELSPKQQLEQTPLGITDLERGDANVRAHTQPWIFVYPNQHAFDAQVALAKDIHVDKPRHLEISLSSGWNDVESIDINLKPASAGLRLHLADASFERIDLAKETEPKPGQVSLAGLEAHSSALVRVPYSLEQATAEILVRFEARYQTSKGASTLPLSVKLPTGLALDVDVNDIFHLDALFSNFTVRTTRGTPLSISQATLEPSAVYDVEAPPVLPVPMTVFEKQPVKLVYKITRKAVMNEAVDKKRAALALSVRYYSVDNLIIDNLRRSLGTALEQSDFASLARLVLPLLCDRTRKLSSRSATEMAVLLNEVRVPSFEEIGWREVIETLPAVVQQPLTECLKTWHQDNTRVTLEQDIATRELQRSITISVDIPRVDFVHRVSLSFQGERKYPQNDPQIVVLGQPVKARLAISNTRNWSNEAIFGAIRSGESNSLKRFYFDVQAEPDSWLVGGQRRGHFKASNNVESTFDIVLIPLKLGLLPLPNVEIHLEQATGDAEPGNTSNETPATSSETHYASAGQLVQVIQGLTSSRVHVPEPSSTGLPSSRPSTGMTTKEAG